MLQYRNFDGFKSSHQASGGGTIRNWTSRLIQARPFNLETTSILVAKATIMRNGIRATIQVGITNIRVERDNKVLIQVV